MQNTCWMGKEVTKFKYRTGRGMAYNSMWHSSDKGFVIYHIFSDLLHRSPSFPWYSCLFPAISVHSMPISVCSVLLRCLLDYSVIHPFPCFPSTPLFRLVSFQFSILGSDLSESGSPLICLHFCSATTPFHVDPRMLLSFYHMTSVSPSNYDPSSYCSALYINLASYVVIR